MNKINTVFYFTFGCVSVRGSVYLEQSSFPDIVYEPRGVSATDSTERIFTSKSGEQPAVRYDHINRLGSSVLGKEDCVSEFAGFVPEVFKPDKMVHNFDEMNYVSCGAPDDDNPYDDYQIDTPTLNCFDNVAEPEKDSKVTLDCQEANCSSSEWVRLECHVTRPSSGDVISLRRTAVKPGGSSTSWTHAFRKMAHRTSRFGDRIQCGVKDESVDLQMAECRHMLNDFLKLENLMKAAAPRKARKEKIIHPVEAEESHGTSENRQVSKQEDTQTVKQAAADDVPEKLSDSNEQTNTNSKVKKQKDTQTVKQVAADAAGTPKKLTETDQKTNTEEEAETESESSSNVMWYAIGGVVLLLLIAAVVIKVTNSDEEPAKRSNSRRKNKTRLEQQDSESEANLIEKPHKPSKSRHSK